MTYTKRQITVMAIVAAISIATMANANQLTANHQCAVFDSLNSLVTAIETWNSSREAGAFLITEMIMAGKIRKIPEGTRVNVLNTASNGVCQVVVDGKVWYAHGPMAFKDYIR